MSCAHRQSAHEGTLPQQSSLSSAKVQAMPQSTHDGKRISRTLARKRTYSYDAQMSARGCSYTFPNTWRLTSLRRP